MREKYHGCVYARRNARWTTKHTARTFCTGIRRDQWDERRQDRLLNHWLDVRLTRMSPHAETLIKALLGL